MYEINVSPRDYRYKSVLNASYSDTIGMKRDASTITAIQNGNTQNPGVTGISMVNTQWYQPLLAPDDTMYVFTLTTPSGAGYVFDDPSWDLTGTIEWILVEYGVTLETEDCLNYTFHRDSLELYKDGVLVYSEGSYDELGTDFDLRKCCVAYGQHAKIYPVDVEPYDPPANSTNGSVTVSSVGEVGEQIDRGNGWESYPINVFQPGDIPDPVMSDPACTVCCWDNQTSLPYMAVHSEELSWRIVLTTDAKYSFFDIREYNISCKCRDEFGNEDPCGQSAVYRVKLYEYEMWYKPFSCVVAPRGAPFTNYDLNEGSLCTCALTLPEIEYTEDLFSYSNGPVCELIREIKYFYKQSTTAISIVISPLCCVGSEPHDCSSMDTRCQYYAREIITWDAVPCYYENDPAIIAPFRGGYMKAFIYGGNVIVRYAHNTYPNWENWIQITTDEINYYPTLAYHDGFIIAYNKAGGGSYLRYSYDNGETWSDEVENLTDVGYGIIRCGRGGDMIHAGIDNDGGDYKIKAKYKNPGDASFSTAFYFKDSAGDDIIIENERFDIDFGEGFIVLTCKIIGETQYSEWLCFDEGETWTRV